MRERKRIERSNINRERIRSRVPEKSGEDRRDESFVLRVVRV